MSETLRSSGVGDISQYQNLMGQVSALARMGQKVSRIKTKIEKLEEEDKTKRTGN